jgi:hypothetical protein
MYPEESDAEQTEEPAEDQPTGPTGAVVRARYGRLALEVFAPILAQSAHLVKAEATEACSHGRGILLTRIPLEAAQATVAALRAQGEESWAVPTEELVPVPPVWQIHAAHLGHEGARVVNSAGHTEEVRWSDAQAMTFARVRPIDFKSKVKPPTRAMRSGFGAAMAMSAGGVMIVNAEDLVPRPKLAGPSPVRPFVELLFAGHAQRFRIDGHEFDYSVLGDQRQEGSDSNIQTLARWLLYAAPHVRTNFDTQALMDKGWVRLAEVPEHGFAEMQRWLVNLLRLTAKSA